MTLLATTLKSGHIYQSWPLLAYCAAVLIIWGLLAYCEARTRK